MCVLCMVIPLVPSIVHDIDCHRTETKQEKLLSESFPGRIIQGQILAVQILAAKLPNSDLKFAVDLWVDFPFFCSRQKRPKSSTKTSPENSPGHLFGKHPVGFLQKSLLENQSSHVY